MSDSETLYILKKDNNLEHNFKRCLCCNFINSSSYIKIFLLFIMIAINILELIFNIIQSKYFEC